MYLWNIEEKEQPVSQQENSYDQALTTSQFTSFRVIHHSLWRWEKLLANLDLRGLVVLPELFWRHEKKAG